jgi:hypothetical protein
MKRKSFLLAIPLGLVLAGVAFAQPYPIVDRIADRVVQKYQAASCEQLWQERAAAQQRPKPAMEQRAIQLLHEDAGARAEFFGRVSAPVVQKMFDCGMIP